jgi:predicted DNA-binding transcriptional regulator YafY
VEEAPACDLPDADLDRALGAGYGIFAGEDTQTAVLRFTPESARWVADEVWHSRQVGRIEADGSYVLELPYSRETELVMDLLRHGAGVEVLGPPALRERVAEELAEAAGQYR